MRSGLWGPLVKVTIFLVVTVVFTSLLAATIQNSTGGKSISYHADFDDVTGVNLDDDVRIAGVRVGSVQDMKLIGPNEVQLTFTVASTRRLPKGAHASLKFRNLIGQRYLSIDPGTGNPNDLLPPHGTIPQSHTTDALNLTQLFDGFQPLFQLLNPTQINDLSGELVQVLQGEGGSISLIVEQLGGVLSALADKDSVIGSLISNLNTVVSAIGSHDDQLDSLITGLQQFISGLAGEKDQIGNSLNGISLLATSLGNLLGQSRSSISADVSQLTTVASTLNANSTTVVSAIQQFPGKIAQLTRPATYGTWFNFYLCSLQTQGLPVSLSGLVIAGTNGYKPGSVTSTQFLPNGERCAS